MRFTTKIFPSRKSNLGILELNNPKALHALSLDMIHCMNDVWDQWSALPADKGLRGILLKATKNSKRPSFCSGGDVKTVWEEGSGGGDGHGKGVPGLLTADFFRDEYSLNYKMSVNDRIPQVSLWDGIVMGGGVGISIHGKYRVATEQTLFAMPEMAIGLFCDVGSMWWMPRILKGGLAPYVALTGARLKAQDLIYTGIATHYVPSDNLEALEVALAEATENENGQIPYNDVVAPVLDNFNEWPAADSPHGFLQQHHGIIDKIFQEDSVESIVSNLESFQDDTFCKATLETLSRQSPTSLKVTLEGLRRGAEFSSIGEALQMEYRMAQAFMQPGSDFYRGIRSVLVEKSKDPVRWDPQNLHGVRNEMVNSYFASLGDHEWQVPTPEDETNSSKL
mmetsp:Transcript_16648/g.25147  ORF Transcript_16648/g.25147 Transcript_16648/m.25147 type:complete len:394 (+) Transcript_16648:23-1204(+)|eukprot:CAMPEP_0178932176 /NCGR_PEP_ID=MMETSP0786-20121207/22431_1 /TAXON_ID=186022 /ORGANISM="Thalassionema frauenfeldii, Strain CCMP 1798" /LENGTH=393 /DNA_ID=CAMNT_0020609357 /DNA_START=8 /DNA_END=1189 /DNA_ORIENTATION=+